MVLSNAGFTEKRIPAIKLKVRGYFSQELATLIVFDRYGEPLGLHTIQKLQNGVSYYW
jgi:hypothetical protein